MQLLADIREIQQVTAALKGTEARWLFPGDAGDRPLTESPVREALRKAWTAASTRTIRVHDLRHTYATLAIQAGVPLLTVSRQLGHADIGTTANVYGHAVRGSNRAAAEAIGAIITTCGGRAQIHKASASDASPAQVASGRVALSV